MYLLAEWVRFAQRGGTLRDPTDGVRVADLPEFHGLQGPRPILYCDHCGGEFSANRGDYFLAAPGTIMRCTGAEGDPHDAEPMRLITKRVVLEGWPR